MDATGHQRRLGVVAAVQPVADACCKSDDIFQCAANLTSHRVGVDVDAQGVAGENLLDLHRRRLVFGRSHYRGRHATSHLFRMGRSGDNTHGIFRVFRLDDLAHGEECLLFQPLAGVHQDGVLGEKRLYTLRHRADKQRRHDKYHHVAVFHAVRIGGEPDTLRDLHARKLGLVFAVPENRLDDLFRNVPDGDLVLILICCDGETDSKAACAENGDFCHMNLLVF